MQKAKKTSVCFLLRKHSKTHSGEKSKVHNSWTAALQIGSAQYDPLETLLSPQRAQNFPSKCSKTSSSVGGLCSAAITGFLGWKYLCYKRSVWPTLRVVCVAYTSSVGKPKPSPVTDPRPPHPSILSPVLSSTGVTITSVGTGLPWVVLWRWLTRNRPGKCFGQQRGPSVGWDLSGLETGSRYVAPRRISRRSNLQGATSRQSGTLLEPVGNNTFCCTWQSSWVKITLKSEADCRESVLSFVRNDDERHRVWEAEKLRENDASGSVSQKGSKIENGNHPSLSAPPAASDGEPGCQPNSRYKPNLLPCWPLLSCWYVGKMTDGAHYPKCYITIRLQSRPST